MSILREDKWDTSPWEGVCLERENWTAAFAIIYSVYTPHSFILTLRLFSVSVLCRYLTAPLVCSMENHSREVDVKELLVLEYGMLNVNMKPSTVEHLNEGFLLDMWRIFKGKSIGPYRSSFWRTDVLKHPLSLKEYGEWTMEGSIRKFNQCNKALPNNSIDRHGVEHSCRIVIASFCAMGFDLKETVRLHQTSICHPVEPMCFPGIRSHQLHALILPTLSCSCGDRRANCRTGKVICRLWSWLNDSNYHALHW